MSSSLSISGRAETAAYTTSIASTTDRIRAAQRLRRAVFAAEFGADLGVTGTEPDGLDVDEVDESCDHLIVEHEPTGEVVGTYRLLPPGRRAELYSESEFDLGALDPIRSSLVEAGRSCVHPAHRTGAVINLMWSALARYTLLSGHAYLAGCASVSLADGGSAAAETGRLARERHSGPAEFGVRPHRPWIEAVEPDGPLCYARVPALLRGYLRLGAWVCGPPAYDPDFGVADFFVLLRLDRMDERYLRYFLGAHR